MSEQAGRRVTTRQARAMAALTVLGIAMFGALFVIAEPTWVMWLLGGLMLLSAAAFWVGYALDRGRRDR